MKIINQVRYVIPLFMILFVLGVFGFVEFLALNDYLKSDTSLPSGHRSEIWGIIHGFRFTMYPVLFSILFSCIFIIIALSKKRNMFFSYAIGLLFFIICLFIYFQFWIIPELTLSIEKDPEYFSYNAKLKSIIYSIIYPINLTILSLLSYFILKNINNKPFQKALGSVLREENKAEEK